ncbi:MAG: 30S ribosome-binding factor RbfA [Gammaproteobacteria bacterium]
MQQESPRPLRVGEQIRRELTMLMRNEVNDPRISEIIIYDVVVTKDLSLARVFFSPMDIQKDPAKLIKGLDSASGYLRTLLSRKLSLRKMPELRFIVDDTEAKSDRIDQILQSNNNK